MPAEIWHCRIGAKLSNILCSWIYFEFIKLNSYRCFLSPVAIKSGTNQMAMALIAEILVQCLHGMY